MRTERYY